MIPYRTDPSLHDHEPAPVVLDDGFSPPAAAQVPAEPVTPAESPASAVPAADDAGDA